MSLPCPTPPACILVAEALPLFRSGLHYVLAQSFPGYQLIEAASLTEAVEATGNFAPEVVILGTGLPDAPAGPRDALMVLRECQPQLAVVALIDPVATSQLAVLRLLKQHVNALLLRTASPEEVCQTVSGVLQRGQCYNDYALGLLQSQLLHRSLSRPADGFSARQLEVLQLIAKDHSTEEISEYLCTSVRTVEYHRSQMLQKAGTRTSLGLVLFAQRQGLLPVHNL